MPSNIKWFVCMGQSNMVGRGFEADIPVDFPHHGDRMWNYKFNGTLEQNPAEPVFDYTGNLTPVLGTGSFPRVGPGKFFADRLLRFRPGISIGLIPAALSGTFISEWARPVGGVDPNTFYGATRVRWEAALASSPGSTIEGVLWWQGSNDAHQSRDPLLWRPAFTQIVADIRSDTGKPNLPFVFFEEGPIDTAFFANPPWTGWLTIQAQERGTVLIPRCTCVPSTNYALLSGDGVHVDTASQKIAGERAADAMRMLGACQ